MISEDTEIVQATDRVVGSSIIVLRREVQDGETGGWNSANIGKHWFLSHEFFAINNCGIENADQKELPEACLWTSVISSQVINASDLD